MSLMCRVIVQLLHKYVFKTCFQVLNKSIQKTTEKNHKMWLT